MARIAIIGSGVAGLGCAYFLHKSHDITVFEKADYVGGHTNTITVPEGTGSASFDTGFMVFNKITYPHLTRLFELLHVAIQPTTMSFSVQYRPANLEYSGSSLNHLFAQRRNLLRPRHWKLLAQIARFNSEAVDALHSGFCSNQTVEDYVQQRGYGDDFLNLFLIPMSGAVWSTPPEKMRLFPAVTLLRFFHNHGFLGIKTHHPWWTVVNGSQSYVKKIVEIVGHDRFHRQSGAVQIRRTPEGAYVTLADGSEVVFDQIILACHADQALKLLANPTPQEQKLLSAFKYQANDTLVHTDASVMPQRRLAWASWNSRTDFVENKEQISIHYWMNSLQGVSETTDYFVSLNYSNKIDPNKILRRIAYEHPLFDLAALNAQTDLPSLNRLSPSQSIYYCGSYFKYGFHEDAFGSAVDLCTVILGKTPWE